MNKEEAREAIKEAYGNSEYTDEIIKTLEQDPCNTCEYGEGSIYCKEHCPHEAKIEQEPCGDWHDVQSDKMTLEQARQAVKERTKTHACVCISKQAVLDIIDSYSESRSNVEDVTQDMISDILALPPVIPQPKTGHWIAKRIGIIDRELYCDQCGEEALADYPSRFCSNCGAKMIVDIKDIEPQERSDKNERNSDSIIGGRL